MAKKKITIDLTLNSTYKPCKIEVTGAICKAEPNIGIMTDFFEIDEINLLEQDMDLIGFIEWCNGRKDIYTDLEELVLEQLKN